MYVQVHDFDLTHCGYTLVGHFYWIFGGASGFTIAGKWINQEKTSLFSLKKEAWIEGPDLPMLLIASMDDNIRYCVSALNRTSTLFLGLGKSSQEVLLYDFANDSWIQLEDMPKKILWCTSSSGHEKDYQQ